MAVKSTNRSRNDSDLCLRLPHNPETVGSSPASATILSDQNGYTHLKPLRNQGFQRFYALFFQSVICQDSRIMDIYNNPSFGYSGYCLPKDTKQLTQQMSGISGTLVAAIDKSNELRKQYIADQIVALYWEKQNTYKGPVGIYDMKIRDYAKESMLQDLLSRIQAAGISVLLFCHAPSSGPEDGEVETDISTFADRCSIIIANRFSPELEPYKNKLYCRDIFNRN